MVRRLSDKVLIMFYSHLFLAIFVIVFLRVEKQLFCVELTEVRKGYLLVSTRA